MGRKTSQGPGQEVPGTWNTHRPRLCEGPAPRWSSAPKVEAAVPVLPKHVAQVQKEKKIKMSHGPCDRFDFYKFGRREPKPRENINGLSFFARGGTPLTRRRKKMGLQQPHSSRAIDFSAALKDLAAQNSCGESLALGPERAAASERVSERVSERPHCYPRHPPAKS